MEEEEASLFEMVIKLGGKIECVFIVSNGSGGGRLCVNGNARQPRRENELKTKDESSSSSSSCCV